jgi:hypothetical protein
LDVYLAVLPDADIINVPLIKNCIIVNGYP